MKVDAISKTISSKGKISCYDCGKEFTNVEKAEKHMPETNCKPNKCNKCEKVFSQRSNLLLHIREVNYRFPGCKIEMSMKVTRVFAINVVRNSTRKGT